MHKKFQIGKEIAEQITISFFIASIIFLAIYFCFSDKISTYLSLINLITITEKQVEEQEITFDSVKKRLATYPKWGTIWATLEIPDINISIPVYQGDSLNIIKYGAGHFSGSYFPGEGASIVLAAHNSREHFMYLPNLNPGAKIIIKANYGTFTYQLTSTKIISDKDSDSLPIQKDKELLILYTCYPTTTIGHKSKRYVVFAELVGVSYAN